MAVRPVPYLVSTRILAALIAIIPLYLISLFASYFATKLVVVDLLGWSAPTGVELHADLVAIDPEGGRLVVLWRGIARVPEGATPLLVEAITAQAVGRLSINGGQGVRVDADLPGLLRGLPGVRKVHLQLARPWAE